MKYPEPAETKTITDPATLKVLADPLRIQILRALEEGGTVKDVAEFLELPATKLYYHVNMLEKHGLLVVVDSNIVSGIIEKVYQIAARRFDLGAEILGEGALTDERLGEMLALIYDGPKAEVRESIRQGLIKIPHSTGEQGDTIFMRTTMRLTPAQVEFVSKRLETMIKSLKAEMPEAGDEKGKPYGLTLTFYPQVAPKIED